MASTPPSGRLTFLFTDIEGSTVLWERAPEDMQRALQRHDALLLAAVEAHGGTVFKTVGDACHAVFPRPSDAVAAAIDGQLSLLREPWPPGAPIRVRMAVHEGRAVARGGDYLGPPLNRCARILNLAYAEQVLISGSAKEGAEGAWPPETSALDLGRHRLRDLMRPLQLFQIEHPGLPRAFPAPRGLDGRPHNLPIRRSHFVGRRDELERIPALLAEHALVTLKGAGGAGKTRLALQVGGDVLDDHPDGVWLVDLAELGDDRLVASAVATALGLRERAGRSVETELGAHLRSRDLLLILDSCEHLLDAVAALVDGLLRACPSLTVLATSREPLSVEGELVYELAPLSTPPRDPDPRGPAMDVAAAMDYESVQLFVDRAQGASRRFELDAETLEPILRICRRLDGLSLAIELAAARTRSLSPAQIADRLHESFHLLAGGARGGLPRQQTIRGAIDWSYELASEAERELFARLAVFRGACTLEAVERVCAGGTIEEWEVLDLVARLVDRSLLQVVEEENGETRYELLQTVRSYAAEKLEASGGAAAGRDRHLDWCMALAEEVGEESEDASPERRLDRIAADYANLRVALSRCAEQERVEEGLRLCFALWDFWTRRGRFTEGRRLVASLLDTPRARQLEPALRARADRLVGGLAYYQGDHAAARESFQAVVAFERAGGDELRTARALHNLANALRALGENEAARGHFQESLALVRAADEPEEVAISARDLALLEIDCGRYAAARSLLEESLASERERDDLLGIAASLCGLAHVEVSLGAHERALGLAQESLERHRALGNRLREAEALEALGKAELERGRFEEACARFEEDMRICRDLGDEHGLADARAWRGLALVRMGKSRAGAEALRTALAAARQVGSRLGEARGLLFLGMADEASARPADARAPLAEALAQGRRIGASWIVLRAIEGLACLAANAGEDARALRWLAAAEVQRTALGLPRTRTLALDPPAAVRIQGCRSALDPAAAEAAWRAGCALSPDEVAREALGGGSG